MRGLADTQNVSSSNDFGGSGQKNRGIRKGSQPADGGNRGFGNEGKNMQWGNKWEAGVLL